MDFRVIRLIHGEYQVDRYLTSTLLYNAFEVAVLFAETANDGYQPLTNHLVSDPLSVHTTPAEHDVFDMFTRPFVESIGDMANQLEGLRNLCELRSTTWLIERTEPGIRRYAFLGDRIVEHPAVTGHPSVRRPVEELASFDAYIERLRLVGGFVDNRFRDTVGSTGMIPLDFRQIRSALFAGNLEVYPSPFDPEEDPV